MYNSLILVAIFLTVATGIALGALGIMCMGLASRPLKGIIILVLCMLAIMIMYTWKNRRDA
jgi:membrane protein implicated in regulation of membrane protease activity